jgi:hypothetical protein
MSNKRQRKRKLQSDRSQEGETEFDASKSFRINTYFVIIWSLLSELDKQFKIWVSNKIARDEYKDMTDSLPTQQACQ